MPVRLCLEPRCASPAQYRGRCLAHARTNEHHTHNRDRKRLYSSKRWRITRERVLYEQPLCACGCDRIATDVDHIVPIEAGGNPWARHNLQALAAECHGRKTRQELATR
jgi:5-methylcytosine-specific restriction endonuclease McrA